MFSQLLQLPPLQNKPFWIYIWDLPFFFFLWFIFAPKPDCLPVNQNCGVRRAQCGDAVLCSSKSKWDEWTAVLFGIHVLPEPSGCCIPSSAPSWNPSRTCLWTGRLVSEAVNLWCRRAPRKPVATQCVTLAFMCHLNFCLSAFLHLWL